MKRVLLLLAFLLAANTFAAAQTQTRERRSSDGRPPSSTESTAVRSRVVNPVKVSNHSEKQNTNTASLEAKGNAESSPASVTTKGVAEPSWGNTAIASEFVAKENSPSRKPESFSKAVTPSEQNGGTRPKLIQPTAMITEAPSVRLIGPPVNASARSNGTSRTSSPSRTPAATTLYRVGVGDVLDIRLANMPTRESTLFTVLNPGVVEYPLLSGTLSVDGLTTDEIAALLSREIKVIDHPRATVTVRDYASHAVTITGMVDSPGRMVLRREAMPLYTVLAEALPRPEATAVTIIRGGKNESLSMGNEQSMSTLVMAGDVIKVSGNSAAPKRFVYVGGDVALTGEREFREGMTLTQALLAASGVARSEKVSAKVARRNASGFLVTSEYNVRAIEEGKAPDPVLEAGDRIEVKRGV
ncbi:MAG TPA: polysaccharide biosynthesis/export family protein [Pyrinomonadaceae bacterium]|nr:polysaccharide biosynthesis/export family protein [Pyrinomonadaceae bacterium]